MSPPYDLAVVGAGLAGMSAAVFAGNRGLATLQVGNAGALLFASGLLDLMGVHPVEQGRLWSDPWAAIAAVTRDLPAHPYARVDPPQIRAAFAEVVDALGDAGLDYSPPGDANREVLTSVGTVKTTYCVPQTMLPGVDALAERAPCLLVDFHGLREYSARSIAEAARRGWPGLRTLRVEVRQLHPAGAASGEAYTAHLARALELAAGRAALAEKIRPHLGDARTVGFPAVLGIRRTELVAADLAQRLGVPVFEIPTIPTSVPGLRLKEALERAVARRGVRRIVQRRVVEIAPAPGAEEFALHLDGALPDEAPLRARAVLLATGRFMGGGLVADRRGVREPLMDLPVVQPSCRAEWHRTDLFDPRGHPVNSAGLAVDATFHPCDGHGSPVHPRLLAAGTVLAHQDWVRMRCGAGVAIATAHAAIAELGSSRPSGALRDETAELGSSRPAPEERR